MVLDAIHFDTIIQGADLVITGEGKVDFQTAKGKTAASVLARAQKQHIPVIAIGGCVELCDSVMQMGFAGIYPILEEKVPLQVAMQREFAMSNVTKTIARILKNSSILLLPSRRCYYMQAISFCHNQITCGICALFYHL